MKKIVYLFLTIFICVICGSFGKENNTLDSKKFSTTKNGYDCNVPINNFETSNLKNMMPIYFYYMKKARAYQNSKNIHYAELFENISGSCAYTALAMLLSYYDTRYDSTLIDSKYEMTDVLVEDYYYPVFFNIPAVQPEKDNTLAYYNAYNQDNIFLSELFKYSNELGFIDFNDKLFLGLTNDQIFKLIKKFISEHGDGFDVVTFKGNEATCNKKIIEGLKLGYPVYTTSENHAFVSYYYYEDSDGDEMICANLGGGDFSSQVVINTKDPYRETVIPTGGFYLVPKKTFEHYCSFKYESRAMTGAKGCGCEVFLTHNTKQVYYSLNGTYHSRKCKCGYFVVGDDGRGYTTNAFKEMHTFRTVGKRTYCTKCDYEVISSGGGIRLDSLSYFLAEVKERKEL